MFHIKKYLLGVIVGITCLLQLSSCGESYFFEEEKNFENGIWLYQDSLDFVVDISDTVQFYSLLLDMNHSVDYKTQNLYIYIHTQMPDGKRLGKQLNIDFAKPTGDWYGACNRKDCDVSINLQKKAYFNQIGTHKFTIKQYMRQDSLYGVNSVAFKMKELEKQ